MNQLATLVCVNLLSEESYGNMRKILTQRYDETKEEYVPIQTPLGVELPKIPSFAKVKEQLDKIAKKLGSFPPYFYPSTIFSDSSFQGLEETFKPMEGDGCGGAREVKPLVKSRVSALTRHPLGKITWFKGEKTLYISVFGGCIR